MSNNAGVIAFQPTNAAHRICLREMDLEEFNEDLIELKSSNEEIQELGGDDPGRWGNSAAPGVTTSAERILEYWRSQAMD